MNALMALLQRTHAIYGREVLALIIVAAAIYLTTTYKPGVAPGIVAGIFTVLIDIQVGVEILYWIYHSRLLPELPLHSAPDPRDCCCRPGPHGCWEEQPASWPGTLGTHGFTSRTLAPGTEQCCRGDGRSERIASATRTSGPEGVLPSGL